MGIEFIAGRVQLDANKAGQIITSFARDASIKEILVNSTGRVEITSMKIEGDQEYLTGLMELDLLKKDGNTYTFPEAIDYKKGSKIVVSLDDFSNASNTVYVAFVVVY